MKISRRKFLAATPVAVGIVLQFKGVALGKVSGKGLFPVPAAAGDDPLFRLTWDSFYPYVMTNFTFGDGTGSTVDLQLTKMLDTKPAGFETKLPGQECFSLTFRGPARRALVQDVYAVDHFALGSFALLITVIGKARKGILYEAVINRIAG